MNSRQDNEVINTSEMVDAPMRMIKLRVPVEEFPRNVNIIGILLGQRGATHKRLEEFSGCTIKVQGKGVRDDNGSTENERLHLQVGYRSPTQLDKLSDLIFALAHRAWNFTGENGAKVVSASSAAQALDSERMAWTASNIIQPSRFMNIAPSRSENIQQASDIGITSHPNQCFEQDRVHPVFPVPNRDIPLRSRPNPSSFSRPKPKQCRPSVHPLILWKFHQLLLSYGKIPAVELKLRYEQYHEEPLVLAMFSDLSQGIEQCLAVYFEVFNVDPESEVISTKLSADTTYDNFEKILALHELHETQTSTIQAVNVNMNTSEACPSISTGKIPPNFASFPFIPDSSQRRSDLQIKAETPFELSQISTGSLLSLKSLFLQLLHRTLVRSGKPLLLENLYKLFEEYWGITFNLNEIGEESLLNFLIKYPDVFLLQRNSSEDGFPMVLPVYQPNFATPLQNPTLT